MSLASAGSIADLDIIMTEWRCENIREFTKFSALLIQGGG
jgi:hypothetical protein